MEAPKRSVKSPLSKDVCQWGGVSCLGYCRILITKISVVIIDGVHWQQNVRDIGLAWRKCTRMSLKDSVLR